MKLGCSLDVRQQRIVPIAAHTASGDMERLGAALHAGLDAGLTINEIKEILLQLYAYAGFPRSVNATIELLRVTEARRARGLRDQEGREASPLPADLDRDAYGATVRARLFGEAPDAPLSDWQRFSPVLDAFLKQHLFADIFARDALSHRARELATISALAVLPGAEGQLCAHFMAARNTGLTAEQLQDFLHVLQDAVDAATAARARGMLEQALKDLA